MYSDRVEGNLYDVYSYLYESDELTIPFHSMAGSNIYCSGTHEQIVLQFTFKEPREMAGFEIISYGQKIYAHRILCLYNTPNRRSFNYLDKSGFMSYTKYIKNKRVDILMELYLAYLIIEKKTDNFFTSVNLHIGEELPITFDLAYCIVPNTNCFLLPLVPSCDAYYTHSINLTLINRQDIKIWLSFDGEYPEKKCPVRIYGLCLQELTQNDCYSINRFALKK